MHVLIHMLGLDAAHRDPWRNHFVAGDDHDDRPELDRLVAAGLVEERKRPGFLPSGDRVYAATPAGIAAAIAENARRNPPPSRDKRRYLAWLRVHDVAPDLTFGDFLKRRAYLECA